MKKIIYLDNSATTAPCEKAIQNTNHALSTAWGNPSSLYDIGFEEYIYGEGVCLIEWAELIKDDLPDTCVWITIEKDLNKGLDYRRIIIEGEI